MRPEVVGVVGVVPPVRVTTKPIVVATMGGMQQQQQPHELTHPSLLVNMYTSLSAYAYIALVSCLILLLVLFVYRQRVFSLWKKFYVQWIEPFSTTTSTISTINTSITNMQQQNLPLQGSPSSFSVVDGNNNANAQQQTLNNSKLRYRLLLIVCTIMYGSNYVSTKYMQRRLAPSVTTTLRFFIAALFFLPDVWRYVRNKGDPMLIYIGMEIGLYCAVAFCVQAVTLQLTSASKNAFLSSLAVVLIPMLDIMYNGLFLTSAGGEEGADSDNVLGMRLMQSHLPSPAEMTRSGSGSGCIGGGGGVGVERNGKSPSRRQGGATTTTSNANNSHHTPHSLTNRGRSNSNSDSYNNTSNSNSNRNSSGNDNSTSNSGSNEAATVAVDIEAAGDSAECTEEADDGRIHLLWRAEAEEPPQSQQPWRPARIDPMMASTVAAVRSASSGSDTDASIGVDDSGYGGGGGGGKLLTVFAPSLLSLVGVAALELGGIDPPHAVDLLVCVVPIALAFSYWRSEHASELYPEFLPVLTGVYLGTAASLCLLFTILQGDVPLTSQTGAALVATVLDWRILLPLVYVGAITTGWTALVEQQAIRVLSATEVSVIYTLEPLFATILSHFMLNDECGLHTLLGAACIIGACLWRPIVLPLIAAAMTDSGFCCKGWMSAEVVTNATTTNVLNHTVTNVSNHEDCIFGIETTATTANTNSMYNSKSSNSSKTATPLATAASNATTTAGSLKSALSLNESNEQNNSSSSNSHSNSSYSNRRTRALSGPALQLWEFLFPVAFTPYQQQQQHQDSL